MDLDRRQVELLHDAAVLDRHGFLDPLAFDQLGYVTGAGDRAAATESLEASVLDHAIIVNFKLQLHNVAAFGRTHDSRPHPRLVLGEAANVTRIVVMVQYLARIGHELSSPAARAAVANVRAPRRRRPGGYSRFHSTDFRSIPSLAISYSGDMSRSRLTSRTTLAAT